MGDKNIIRKKRVLVQAWHPAQLYFYSNIIKALENIGYEPLLLISNKDVSLDIAKAINVRHIVVKHYIKSLGWRFLRGVVNCLSRLEAAIISIFYIIGFRPSIVFGMEPVSAFVCKLLRIPYYVFVEDDYNVISELIDSLAPWVTAIVSPNVCDLGPWNCKKIGYDGYMKLAYLNPKCFSPLLTGLEREWLGEKYAIIRLVALAAYHDKGKGGIGKKRVGRIIKLIENYGYRVFVSAEDGRCCVLEEYRLLFPTSRFHDVLSFASVVVCDGQSVCVEAALLGVPVVRINDFCNEISVLNELEDRYGLVKSFKSKDLERALIYLRELLEKENFLVDFQLRRKRLLEEKSDVLDCVLKIIGL